MNRTKRTFINSLTAALFSIIQIAIGIALPRLIIGKFGSDINGLTVSIQQFVSYLGYLELGLSSVFIYSLYKPLTLKDEGTINGLVSSAKKSYNRTSLFYLIGVIILASIYPFIANTGEIDIWVVIFLVFIIGASGLLEMYSVAKYRVLLTADQKVYVLNLSFAISIIVSFAIAFILIMFNQHIILVKASAFISILFRTIFLHFYTKKKYPYIKYDKYFAKTTSQAPVKRFDAVLMQLSKTVAYSLPILALSILSSMKIVSIFSVYYLVFHGLQTILGTITSGSTATFGEMISKNEMERARNAYSQFELILINTQTILYATSIILIIPFVQIYVGGIPDASDYVNLSYGILFVSWAYIDNFRLPAQTIIQAAGKFRESRLSNILYMVIEVVLLAVLTPFLGIIGALIAMIITSAFKGIWFLAIVDKFIFDKSHVKSILRFFQGVIIVTGCFFIFQYVIHLEILDIGLFIMWGFIMVLAISIVTFATNFILDKRQTISILKRIMNMKHVKM
jgi:O-antigen/teichoic acid export membrane protein